MQGNHADTSSRSAIKYVDTAADQSSLPDDATSLLANSDQSGVIKFFTPSENITVNYTLGRDDGNAEGLRITGLITLRQTGTYSAFVQAFCQNDAGTHIPMPWHYLQAYSYNSGNPGSTLEFQGFLRNPGCTGATFNVSSIGSHPDNSFHPELGTGYYQFPSYANRGNGPKGSSEIRGGFNPSEVTSGGQGCHADPVNTATGGFFECFTDFAVPGRGPGLSLSRSYDSTASSATGAFGYGWADSTSMSLTPNVLASASGTALADAAVVDVVQENGSRVAFVKDASGAWVTHGRVLASLTSNADGTYTFTRRGRAIFTFDASGRLSAMKDLNDEATTLAYSTSGNSAGKLATLTDGAGRTLTFTWTGDRITKVVGPLSATVTYTYDSAGNLTSVTAADGGATRFAYDGYGRMTTMTTPRGSVTTNAYDNTGRVTSQTDPLGKVTTFAYDGQGPGGTWNVTITNPVGTKVVETYTDSLLTQRVAAADTSAAATTTFTYDPDTLGVATTTDPLGRVTTTTWDDAGHPLTVTDPLGRVTSTTYDALGNVTSNTTPSGASTTYTYDTRGNRLTTSAVETGTTKTVPFNTTFAATATASSQVDAARAAAKAIDGIAEGSPRDPSKEWASNAEKTGAWLKLTWDNPVRLNKVILFDRPNTTDRVTSGTLTFSDGSSIDVPALRDDGNATTVSFSARATTTVTFTVTGVSTSTTNIGLAELQAWAPAAVVTNPATRTLTSTNTYGDTDHPGQVTAITDARGKTTTLHYDTAGNLTSSVDAAGNTTSATYDAAGNKTSTTSARGNVNANAPPTSGSSSSTSGAAVDPADFTTTYTYDAAGRLTSTSDPLGHTSTLAYDADGNLVTTTDATGKSATTTYDAAGRPTKVTAADGSVTTAAYDDAGRVTSTTDAAGKTTATTYDPLGRALTTTDTAGRVTTATYDLAGQLTTSTDALGVTTTNTYDEGGQLKKVDFSDTTADIAYAYDADGRRTAMSDATGTSSYAYDSLGQLVETSNGAGVRQRYTYDQGGNQTRSAVFSAATGVVETTRAFDDLGHLVTLKDPAGKTYTFDYTADGALQTTRYPNGTATAYTYDNAGRPTSAKTTAADGTTITDSALTLDAVSRVTTAALTQQPVPSTGTSTGASSGTASTAATASTVSDTYAYNDASRLRTHNGATYGYDTAGNLVTTPTAAMTYDQGDQLATWTPTNPTTGAAAGPATAFTFDAGGRRTSATPAAVAGAPTTAGAGVSTYAYDAADNLTALRIPTAITTGATTATSGASSYTYAYDGDGLRQEATNAVVSPVTVLARDSFARTTTSGLGTAETGGTWTATPTAKTAVTAGAAAFTMSPAGQTVTGTLGSLTQTDSDTTVTIAFDKPATGGGIYTTLVGRKIAGKGDYQVLARARADKSIGLELKRTEGSTSTTLAGSTLNGLTWEANQKLTVRLQVTGTSPTTVKAKAWATGTSEPEAWQLSASDSTAALQAPGSIALVSYLSASATNAPLTATFSDLIATTSPVTTRSSQAFIWDTTAGLAQLVSDGLTYVYGPGGQPLAQINPDGTSTYLVSDATGAVRALTDANGAVTGTYAYSPYGTPTHTGAAQTRLQYGGQYTDPSGLIYLRARYYDPATSQFLTRDPLEGATGEPYSYASGDPINRADPSGLMSWRQVGNGVVQWMFTPGGQRTMSFGAGFDDALTFGASTWAMNRYTPWLSSCFVNTEGGWFLGGQLTGTAAMFAVPGGGEAAAARLGIGAARGLQATEDSVTLYRWMSHAEAADVVGSGGFRAGSQSMSGKWFASSEAQARAFGGLMKEDGVATSIQVPKSVRDAMFANQNLDGLGAAYYAEDLAALNASFAKFRNLG